MADGDQGPDCLPVPDALDVADDLGRAPGDRKDAAASRAEPGRQVRLAAVPDGRDQAAAEGGHRPARRRQDPVLAGAGDRDDPRLHQHRDHSVRPRGLDLRPSHAAAAGEPARRGAAGARDELDGRLRDRAGRLVVVLAVFAARRPALIGPGDQLRDRDGHLVRAGVPVRRIAVHVPDRRRSGTRLGVPPVRGRAALPVLVRDPAASLVRDLRDHDGGRDQPASFRPAGGRRRAGRRVPHRVLLAEVRAVLPGRVRQHDHRVGARGDVVPRRLARDLADLDLVGRQ